MNPNTIEGASINSNSDNSVGEHFVVNESGVQVFFSDGNVQTNTSNANNVGIVYDSDDSGAGTFAITTAGANVLTANNAGTVTIANAMVANGIDNGGDGISNAGAISGVTTLNTSGLATLNSANVTTTLGVNGAATLNNTLGVAGATTLGNTLGVSGATTLGNTLNVGGATTLNNTLGVTGSANLGNTLSVGGATTLNNTLSVDSNGASAGGTRLSVNGAGATTASADGNTTSTLNNSGHVLAHIDGTATNSITVFQTQQETIGVNTFSYGTRIDGGALVQGDLGVNGSIYALNPTANTGINVGNNGLSVNGATNTASLVADSNSTAGDGRSVVSLQEDQASMVVYNRQTGQAHGLTINQSSTVLSGGTTSTTLTLNDDGATFANTATGGPARVTGVADGVDNFDAINYSQLKGAYGGIASVAAMANIPAPPAGKSFSIGIGFGNFEGENAFALGGAARLSENISVQASVGRSDDNSSLGAGVGFSW